MLNILIIIRLFLKNTTIAKFNVKIRFCDKLSINTKFVRLFVNKYNSIKIFIVVNELNEYKKFYSIV